MGNKKIILSLLVLFMFTFVVAQDYLPHQYNSTLNFSITSNFATNCTLKNINSPTGLISVNQLATGSGSFDFEVLGGNYSTLGNFCHNVVCTNGNRTTSGQECRDVTLSGVERNMTLIILDMFLIIGIISIIMLLHYSYRKKDYSSSDKKISESHNGNWGKTFIKSIGNNFMRNSFLWYYSLGWLLVIVLKDLVYNFGSVEVYNFFVFTMNIYSFGFFLVIIVWIGILFDHFRIITDLINDINLGVDR